MVLQILRGSFLVGPAGEFAVAVRWAVLIGMAW